MRRQQRRWRDERRRRGLTLTLWPNGEAGDSITWTLQCEPRGGDHPDPEAACAALTAVADPFGPVAAPKRCAEIPGGDEGVAVVDSYYRGRTVHSRFTHENACKSGRWDRIAPVFSTGFEVARIRSRAT